MKLDVIIKSIENVVHKSQADEVILPAVFGKIGVRLNHANASVVLSGGEIVIKLNDTKEIIAINGGIAQVTADKVDILLSE